MQNKKLRNEIVKVHYNIHARCLSNHFYCPTSALNYTNLEVKIYFL
jgi:hypothetical protein